METRSVAGAVELSAGPECPLLFNRWSAPCPENDTSVAELQKIFKSTYVITPDEMPSLR